MRKGIIFLLIVGLCGCATTGLRTSIKAYSDPEKDLTRYKKFSLLCISKVIEQYGRLENVLKENPKIKKSLEENPKIKKYVDKLNPLLEKELLKIVKEKMINKGYLYDENNPDFYIFLFSECTPFQQYIPLTTVYLPKYEKGEKYTGRVGDKSVTIRSKGKLVSEPHTRGGFYITSYFRHIVLTFGECNKGGSVFWMGEAESSGKESDIRKVAPYLLDELLEEFPFKTDKPTKRIIKIEK